MTGSSSGRPMVIDCHVHAWPPEDLPAVKNGLMNLDADLPPDSPFNWTPRYDGDLETAVATERAAGVDRFVLLSVSSRPERCPVLTRWVAEAARRHPEIIPFGAVHPYTPTPEDDIAVVLDQGIRGIKLHSLVQRFNPLSPEALNLFRLLEQAGLVILMDSMNVANAALVKPVLEPFVHVVNDLGLGTGPREIAAIATRHPRLRIIAAHMGCLYGWDELDPLLGLANVYFDLGYVHRLLTPAEAGAIIRKKGVERVLFGSDAPYRRPGNALAWFFDLPLTPEERERILSANLLEAIGADG